MKKRPYQANRMLAVVGSLYAFAGKRKLVPGGFNPVRGMDESPEMGRERFLSGQELARLGGAPREAETIGIPSASGNDEADRKTRAEGEEQTNPDRRALVRPQSGC